MAKNTLHGRTAAWHPGKGAPRPRPDGLFTSAEVILLTGMSYRQLDHALRTYIELEHEAHGSGSQRLFTPQELAVVFAYAAMQESGIPKNLMQEALDMLKTQDEWGGYLLIAPDGVTMGVWGETKHDRSQVRWSTLVPLHQQEWRNAQV